MVILPPESDSALRAAHHRLRQVVKKIGFQALIGLGFVLGGHFLGIQHMEYLLPVFSLLDVLNGKRQAL